MSEEFSLRILTAQVLAEMDTEDREQVLKEIERRVPPALVAEAFHQALPPFVHSAVPRWPFAIPKRDEPVSPAKGRSSKVAAIRDAWKRHLEGRYTVEDGSLRRLGDFRYADLMFMAGELEDKARKNRARAAAMKALAGALNEHGVSCVRELPAGYLAEFFGPVTA